jgi:hypothetical protein
MMAVSEIVLKGGKILRLRRRWQEKSG